MISINPLIDKHGDSMVSDDDLLDALDKLEKSQEIEKIGVGTTFSKTRDEFDDRYKYLQENLFSKEEGMLNGIVFNSMISR